MAEKIYWVTPEGGTVDLTDGVMYAVRQGVDGRHMPEHTFTSEKIFTYPGELLRNISVDKREITLPMYIGGSTPEIFRNNQRFLENCMDPMRGEGKLKIVTADAGPKTRVINCHLMQGMSYQESGETGSSKFRIYVLTFIAHSPYWYDPVEIEKVWGNYTTYLSYPQIVYNYGDVDTWPQISVVGPFTTFKITNESTNKFLLFNTAISTSKVLIIDCRPGYRSCCINHVLGASDGPPPTKGNVFKYLSTTSNINFNLQPGENRLSFYASAGATSATTAFMRWVNRYNGV